VRFEIKRRFGKSEILAMGGGNGGMGYAVPQFNVPQGTGVTTQ